MARILSLINLLIIISFTAVSQQNGNKTIVSDDIEITKLSENVYLHCSYYQTETWGKVGANGLIVIENGKALIIDTPWDNKQTEKLFNWIKDSLNATTTTFIATHWHEDCIGGLGYLQSKGVKSYANKMTIDIAKEKKSVIPQQGFSDSLKIDFQNIPIECYFLGGGHSIDNIVVWIPTRSILFGGCCIKEIRATSLGNIVDADIKAWPITAQKISNKFTEAEIVVPGHGNIGGKELIEHTLQLLRK